MDWDNEIFVSSVLPSRAERHRRKSFFQKKRVKQPGPIVEQEPLPKVADEQDVKSTRELASTVEAPVHAPLTPLLHDLEVHTEALDVVVHVEETDGEVELHKEAVDVELHTDEVDVKLHMEIVDVRVPDEVVEHTETSLDEEISEGQPAYYGSYGKGQKKKKKKKVKKPFFSFTNKLFLAVLAGSIVINVGAGGIVYKLLKDRKARFASPVSVTVTQQETEPEKTSIRQVINWSDEQKAILSKSERILLEERFSRAVSDDYFSTSSFDFIFVPRVNQFVVRHDGALSVSAFFHNGHINNYETSRLNIVSNYKGKVLMSGIKPVNITDSTGKSTYLLQMTFDADDIRDPKILDELLNNPDELANLSFDVSISYKEEKIPGNPNSDIIEKWEPMKTHTVADKATKEVAVIALN